MDHTRTPSVSLICDTIGRRRIAHEIGVRLTSVSNAVTDERFPARWFDIIERLCSEAGIPCPRHLFSFVGVDGEQQGDGDQVHQSAASAAPTQEQSHVSTPDESPQPASSPAPRANVPGQSL